MTSMRTKSIILFVTLLSSGGCSYAAELLKGDASAATTESFSFPVSAHLSVSNGQALFVGAKSGTSNEYALASIKRDETSFSPLTPQNVTINKISGSNPLYNKSILFLSLFETPGLVSGIIERPVLVSEADQKRLFVLENSSNLQNIIMLASNQLNDAAGLVTGGIVGLAGANLGRSGHIAFVAVKDKDIATFGEANSGIAMASYIELKSTTTVDGKKVEHTERLFDQVDAQATIITPALTRAAPFNRTLDAIKIGTDVAALTLEDMYWDQHLNRLYIALNVTAADDAVGDGARSVVVGRLVNTQTRDALGNQVTRISLTFDPIVSSGVFAVNGIELIGALAADAQVSAHKVRILHTSTRLNYLIILGGNGAPNDTKKTVYALPLVNNPQSPEQHGTLASINATPEDVFIGQNNILYDRHLKTPATVPDDIFVFNDAAAKVGTDEISTGTITDIFVQSDAVFVAVGEADTDQLPGLFVSTALFDELGRIKGWTQWQRVAGTTEKTFSGFYDPERGSFAFLTGTDANSLKTAQRTMWTGSTGSEATPLQNLIGLLSREFSADTAGIHALFDFPKDTSGLGSVSWMIATGLRKIALIETGRTLTGTFTPNSGDFSTNFRQETTGGITGAISSDCKFISISGGVLNDLGAITAAEIADGDDAKRFVVVGGVNGVAILTKSNGDGWSAMGSGFSGLVSGMTFKKIGNYRFVRKLICSQEYLYVLTDTEFDRVDIAASNFATGTLVVTRLATRGTLLNTQESFLDALVSEKLALLATSFGLLRSGNGVDIASPTLTSQSAVAWTTVTIPQSLVPISYLYPISSTLLANNVASTPGGMVYAISGDIGNNRARLVRMSVSDAEANQVSNTTVQALNDIFVKSSPCYFANLSGFRNLITTDGSIRFITVDKNLGTSPSTLVLPPYLATGISLAIALPTALLLNFSKASDIVACLRTSALGSWVIAGDFGMLVNE